MKFISPVQSRSASITQSAGHTRQSQKSFSSIFTSEIRSLSKQPELSSSNASPATGIDRDPVQNAKKVDKASFSQLFPNLSTLVIDRADTASKDTSQKIVPGIVNIPAPDITAIKQPLKQQPSKKTGSIDIASIVNFRTSGPNPLRQATQDGTIASVGDNPSLVVSSRSQAPSTQWERCHMDSSPQSGQGGILAGGVIVAFKVEIG